MKKKKKILTVTIAVVAVLGVSGIVTIISNATDTYLTATASYSSIDETVSEDGYVESELTKTYYSNFNAPISELKIKLGDKVVSGDALLTFDTTEYELAANQAELSSESTDLSNQSALNINSRNATEAANASTSIDILNQQIEDEKSYIANLQESMANAEQTASEIASISTELATTTDAKEAKSLQKQLDNLNDEYDSYDVPNITSELSWHQTQLTEYMTSRSEYIGKQTTANNSLMDSAAKEQLGTISESSDLTEENASNKLDEIAQGITADFNGVVTSLLVDEGSTVTQGTPLFEIQSKDDMKVTVQVSKYDIGKIAEGQTADISIADQEYTGTVTKIYQMATSDNSDKKQVAVDIHIENPSDDIYLGLEADVVIHTSSSDNTLTVPITSLYSDNNGDYCYTLENGEIQKTYVTSGLQSDDYVEIIDGLSEGTLVINDSITDDKVGTKAKSK